MKTHMPEDMEKELERLSGSLPSRTPSGELWQRIETGLRQEQLKNEATREKELTFFRRIFLATKKPVVVFSAYAVMILAGIAMSFYLLTDSRQLNIEFFAMDTSEDILLEANKDIEQAIFYYERAIKKLTVLAEHNEEHLDPSFVAVQKEKIELLRESITECKTALNENHAHPRVQHSLLTAYNDLQETLQEMISFDENNGS